MCGGCKVTATPPPNTPMLSSIDRARPSSHGSRCDAGPMEPPGAAVRHCKQQRNSSEAVLGGRGSGTGNRCYPGRGAARNDVPNESTRERLIRTPARPAGVNRFSGFFDSVIMAGVGTRAPSGRRWPHRGHPNEAMNTVSNVGTSGEMPVNNRARTGKIGGRDLSDVATPATELDSRNTGNRRKNLARAVIQPSGYMTRARFQRRIARLGALLRRLPRARQLVIMAILRGDGR